ncbi:MAG: hypothetical protein A2Y07_04765 [Planctomycetes bacterium GWF2_50_10]|nr:MAG: hypothetical protein A2Y07_04765 [Planctomycetes bacterium GWF2_50_10]
MINTLRITSIVASGLAIVFLSLSVFFGLKPDPAKADFITELTTFNNEKLTSTSGMVSNKKDSPLVLQAQAYTLKVNPPKPREEVSIAAIRQEPEVRFKLIGTAFYPETPEKNMALIDSPGKGQHWVKVNENVEGIKIEKILDGKVIYNKNGKSMALSTSNKPGDPQEASEAVVVEDQNPSAIPVTAEPVAEPPLTPEQRRKAHQETMEFLKQIAADQNGSEEAAQLGDLKEFMDEVEKEFNAQETADANAEGGADPMAPSADENGSVDANDANAVNTEQADASVTAEAAVSEANENGEVNAEPAPEPVQQAAPSPGESRSRIRPRRHLTPPAAAAGTE